MIRFFKVALVLFFGLFISCKKDDDAQVQTPMIPYAFQYPFDIEAIEKYLDGHYIQSISPDMDVTITAIPADNPPVGDPEHKTSMLDDTTNHPLQYKIVNSNGVDYKVYYLNLREAGNYGTNKKVTSVDSVFVSYKGRRLDDFVFDQAQNPVWFVLDLSNYKVIDGWKEIIPLFKTGTASEPDSQTGNITYSDFGAGIMFLPSGLAYYNRPPGADIPNYAPLIFSFKLKGVNYVDNDYDGIESIYEDLNGDGIYLDDTDGDNHPDYIDQDDDGDTFLTKTEIRKPTPILAGQGPSYFYPFNAFTVANDPNTPEDESVTKSEPKGIPNAAGDGMDSGRLRRHRDPNARPPYTTY